MPIEHAPLLTNEGAHELAQSIQKYWAERGHWVNITIFPIPRKDSNMPLCACIRTDMLNGMPRTMYDERWRIAARR